MIVFYELSSRVDFGCDILGSLNFVWARFSGGFGFRCCISILSLHPREDVFIGASYRRRRLWSVWRSSFASCEMDLQGESDELRKRGVCVFLMAWLVLGVAAQSSTLTLSSTMTSTLLSQNGVFQLGFVSGSMRNLPAPVYTLGIWHAALSDKTVVWVANRSMALRSINPTLSLSALGDLQVHDNSVVPRTLVWRSDTENLNVVSASIEDSGNLVLRTEANQVVWQSFDRPTDTLLPGQRFPANSSSATPIKAWERAGDWREGNFSLAWITENRTLQASWQNPYPWSDFKAPAYYKTYWTGNLSTNVALLTSDGLFQANTLARLTLEADGNIRIYSWSNSSASWNEVWKALDNNCDIIGYCGPYSICRSGTCQCPEKFHLVDISDTRLGCQRGEPREYCNTTGPSLDTFVQVMDVDWPYNDLTTLYDVGNATVCVQRCLDSCECQAAIFNTPVSSNASIEQCWHKKDVLLNGRPLASITAFLRVGSGLGSDPTSDVSGAKSLSKLWISVGVIGGALVVVAIASLGFYFYSRQYFLDPADKAFQARLRASGGSSVAFSEAMINRATNNNQTLLGRGGFGDVFYGKLRDGTEVAAKVLSAKSHQSKQEFYNEIELLSKVHQKYLVSLLGYSCTRKHQILIYEFMSGGNLRQRLQGVGTTSSSAVENPFPDPLTWQQRTRIILHVAEGLEYLHHKCSPPIIHRDIKSSNILLTSKMVAKVADFGLSKLKTMGDEDATHVTTVVKGTPGYLDPEYQESGMLTEKSDVYAFGVVLLEVLTGRNQMYIVHRVREAWKLEQFEDIADPNVREDYDTKELINLVELALWCTRMGGAERPSMDQVVRRLYEILLPPPEPSNMSDEDGHHIMRIELMPLTFDSVSSDTQGFSESSTFGMSSEVPRKD